MIFIRNIPSSLNRKIANNFRAREFRCNCGKCRLTLLHPYGLNLLVCVRNLYGSEIIFSSAYRCQEHNRNTENAADFSYHPRGMAWDIELPKSKKQRELLIRICEAVFPYTYIDDTFIHCDIRGFETRTI